MSPSASAIPNSAIASITLIAPLTASWTNRSGLVPISLKYAIASSNACFPSPNSKLSASLFSSSTSFLKGSGSNAGAASAEFEVCFALLEFSTKAFNRML